MRLQPYPKYKTSGVEWLGEVPEHWKIPSLYLRYQVDLGKMLNETGIRGGHLHPYLRNVDVQWNHINVADLPQIDIGPWEIARFTVRRGDLLVCEGGEVGRAALVQDDADGLGYQKALHRLRPVVAGEDPRFMFYTLYGAAQGGVFVAEGNPNTIAHLTGEKLRRYRFPTPPAFEQSAIADFLDGETAKIDTLVAKKRTLIERLNEKRAALISRTVTRGLPPDAASAAGLEPHPKLKSTGIGWLGEVPEHWEVKPLGRLVRFAGGATPDKGMPEYWDGDIPWVSPKDMKRMRIDDVPNHVSREGLSSSALTLMPALSVLIVVRGMILAHSFPVAITAAPVTINQDMKALTSGKRLTAEFLLWLLTGLAGIFVSLADESAHGTRKLESEIVARVRVALPSTDEQISIVEFLDRETGRLDTLVTKIETAIERLREYRTALITAAVTGKIDVRGTVVREEDAT